MTSEKKFKVPKLFWLLLLSFCLFGIDVSFAQNVGIGIAAPADKLHVNGGTIRVSNLASGTTRAVLADALGRLIVASASNSPDWTITGNTGTTPAANFIGTTDAADFVIRSNNIERVRILSGGKVGIGVAVVGALDLVDVVGSAATPYPLNGYITLPGAGVYGQGTGGGYGVYGNSSLYGVFGQGGSAGLYGWDSAATGFAVIGNQRKSGNNAIAAIGGGINVIYLPAVSVGLTSSGDTIGLYAKAKSNAATSGAGTGIVGVGNGLGVYTTLGRGSGIAGTGLTIGTAGFATSGLSGTAGVPTAGGYFENALGATSINVYVAAYNGTTQFKILGSGTVSTIVKDINENNVIMFSTESPEVLFQDYGSGQLQNGFAHITLDPVFSKNILISETTPLRVFIQLEGDCNGVYVSNKNKTGFDVYELKNGNSNTSFTYTVIGNRADEPGSKYAGIRFPAGPLLKESSLGKSTESHAPGAVIRNEEGH
jgi:hypothetical protein